MYEKKYYYRCNFYIYIEIFLSKIEINNRLLATLCCDEYIHAKIKLFSFK